MDLDLIIAYCRSALARSLRSPVLPFTTATSLSCSTSVTPAASPVPLSSALFLPSLRRRVSQHRLFVQY
ncbi:hypothetical protein CaCOL14_004077 [Colletotrichum acutatum]